VTRWGGNYPHFVVLDADSLMSGDAIVGLAAAMEADPGAGIIQTLPLIVNRNTLFARVQQFAARIYGPVIAAGLATWMGRDGNYWGHNAIIRTKAFAAHCGLPSLRGRPPFGGHILSHDFVEAALIRRPVMPSLCCLESTPAMKKARPRSSNCRHATAAGVRAISSTCASFRRRACIGPRDNI
jgi:membrane glycosyltransferase